MKTVPWPIEDGDIVLAPSWALSANHSASSYGVPVLVNRSTGDAFGPADIVAPGGRNHQPARMFVHRMAQTLRDEGKRQTAMDW
jgi:hypothetical protein